MSNAAEDINRRDIEAIALIRVERIAQESMSPDEYRALQQLFLVLAERRHLPFRPLQTKELENSK